MKAVGAITIGQTPRDDIVAEMDTLLGADVRVLQAGALDDLSRGEIDALAPAPGQDALVTRLRDGSEVLVAKRSILGRLQACLDALAHEADAFTILCAGTFPPLRSARPILMPERLVAAAVDAVFDGGRLGVIVPIPHQRESATARWSRVDPRVSVVVASPYQDASRLVDASEELRRAGVTLVVMECLGFTDVMKSVVRDITGAPALLPASLIARFLAELA